MHSDPPLLFQILPLLPQVLQLVCRLSSLVRGRTEPPSPFTRCLRKFECRLSDKIDDTIKYYVRRVGMGYVSVI